MASGMKRSEVLSWLQAGGGQKGQAQIEYESMPNPKFTDADAVGTAGQKTVTVKKVTWTRADGETLSVYDRGEMSTEGGSSTGPDPGMPGGTNTGSTTEPVYEVAGGAPKKDPVDNRNPEDKENDAELTRQKRANRDDPSWGRYQTDAERRRDEREDETRARGLTEDTRRNDIAQSDLDIRRAAEARAANAQAVAEARGAEQSERDNRRLTIDEDRFELDRQNANKKTVIGQAGYEDKYIATFNPMTGETEQQSNPLYDEVRTAAKNKKEELALAIQMREIDAKDAALEYQKWYQENVELPFKASAERRAQTADVRQGQEMEERRRQFKSSNDLARANLGQQAGQAAVQNEISMMPFRAGPEFGEQFSSAVNSLAGGGGMNANAAAGINFTADAFEYKRPNLKKISEKAVKAALKGVSRYDPDEGGQTAYTDYTGFQMPDFSGAPSGQSSIDVGTLWNNTYGNSLVPPPTTPFQFQPGQ